LYHEVPICKLPLFRVSVPLIYLGFESNKVEEINKNRNGENTVLKKIISSLLAVIILLSIVDKNALASSPNLDLRVVKGVALYTITGMKNTEVCYQFYRKHNGEYINLIGECRESSTIGHANIRKDGEYMITYSLSTSTVERQKVKFKIDNSVNDIKSPSSQNIIDTHYIGKPITVSLQTKNKYEISLGDYKLKNQVVYKMYRIEKYGKLKHLYTRTVKNGYDGAYFPEYRKSRYLLVTATYKNKTKNIFFVFTPDLKYFENYFVGRK